MGLGEKIRKLRIAAKLTQMEFAEMCGVTTQAIQKWENGSYSPSLEKLVLLSKHFHVSLDELVMNSNQRAMEEQQHISLAPSFALASEGEFYSEQLLIEYIQSVQEGKNISSYHTLFDAIQHMPRNEYKERMAKILFELILNATDIEDYPYVEPSDYEEIRHEWAETKKYKKTIDAKQLKEKIAGAWYGRICGCLLGKPVEGIHTSELLPILQASGNYPMHRYIQKTDLTEEIIRNTKFSLEGRSFADTVTCMPTDDDTNYVVLNQELIEKYGFDFTPADVSRIWINSQSKNAYWTAERTAYCNFVNGYLPPISAVYKNPYREWIGAQIRADYFGYIHPGMPEAAAQMAWRDASISHVKNGIYGEMWIAALLAIAAIDTTVSHALYESLNYIPQKSRLAEHLKYVIRDYEEKLPVEKCFQNIHARWDEENPHDFCHTISNAEIVAASLLYGHEDFGKSICLAVQTGFDTDCNGATVGSIVSICHGFEAIDSPWIEPLHGKLNTSIFGLGMVRIDDRVALTMKHIDDLNAKSK